MLKKYHKLFKKQNFDPGIMGIFINPFYFARKSLTKNIKLLSKDINGNVLDVGCGQKPYKHLFKCNSYTGLDIDTEKNRQNKKIDKFYNGSRFPFENSKFDSIFSSQVLEHIFNPNNFLEEINRVLIKNGHLLLTIPFVWGEHEQPHDYARYSSFGIKYLLNKHGFKIIKHIKSVNNIEVIFQLINIYVNEKIKTKNYKLKLIFYILLISPFNMLGIILSKLLPSDEDLYLDNIILAKKIKNV